MRWPFRRRRGDAGDAEPAALPARATEWVERHDEVERLRAAVEGLEREEPAAADAAERRAMRRALSTALDAAVASLGEVEGDPRSTTEVLAPSPPPPTSASAAPPPAPFLVGAPRSGTTLLRLMLDAHPLLAIPPETGFLVHLIDDAFPNAAPSPAPPAALPTPDPLASPEPPVDRFLRIAVASPTWPDFRLPERDLRAALDAARPRDLGACIRVFYGLLAAREGKPRWGDKTPNYGLQIPRIRRLVPEARFVHIVRDPRDVVVSVRGEWFRAGDDPAAMAADWVRRVEAARAAGAGEEDFLEIRYEDLVRRPEEVLRRVCTHLELPFDPAMLDYPRQAERRLSALPDRLAIPGGPVVLRAERIVRHRFLLQAPAPERIGRWRGALDAASVEAVEAAAGPLMRELGYLPSPP